ncbi:hypothetical protein ACI8AA_01275 [Geodermatophilus sp. SYSU D01180]
MEYTAAAALPYDNRERAAAGLRGQLRLKAVAAGATPDWATFAVTGPTTHPGRHRGQVWFEWWASVEVAGGHDLTDPALDALESPPRRAAAATALDDPAPHG